MLPQGSPTPSFINFDEAAKTITLDSEDINDQGVYQVSLTVSTPSDYAYSALSVTQQVELDVKFDCA